jgi:hypothetical protein
MTTFTPPTGAIHVLFQGKRQGFIIVYCWLGLPERRIGESGARKFKYG